MNSSGLVALDTKVLVCPDVVEEKTAGGIIRPDIVREKEKYACVRATVVDVGPSAYSDWQSPHTGPKAGDRVVIAQYAGMTIKGDDGVDYRLINDEDLAALIGGSQ